MGDINKGHRSHEGLWLFLILAFGLPEVVGDDQGLVDDPHCRHDGTDWFLRGKEMVDGDIVDREGISVVFLYEQVRAVSRKRRGWLRGKHGQSGSFFNGVGNCLHNHGEHVDNVLQHDLEFAKVRHGRFESFFVDLAVLWPHSNSDLHEFEVFFNSRLNKKIRHGIGKRSFPLVIEMEAEIHGFLADGVFADDKTEFERFLHGVLRPFVGL